MKTTEFIVEYAGIGDDADAMSSDHEVQLARQQCYNAARDAIALHHILKDTPEQENLEDWVVEKLTQAASNLKDVIEHLEEQRNGGDGEEMDIMSAFSFESAEAKYAELLSESEQIDELLKMSPAQADMGERISTLNKAYISARNLNDLVTMRKIKAQLSQLAARKASMAPIGEEQVNELYADRAAENEWHQQERPRGQVVGAPVQAARSFFIVDRATGKKLKAFNVRSEAERAAARMGGFSKFKVAAEGEEIENDADPITELKLKPEFAGDSGEGIDMPARKPVAATPGVKVTKVGTDTYRVSYKGKSIECSRREVPHYKQEIMGEGQVNELDSSTMKSYMQKRKESPMPKTVHKAVNQANGVRSASEKIHDQLVKKHAIAGGDTRVREEKDVPGYADWHNARQDKKDKAAANRKNTKDAQAAKIDMAKKPVKEAFKEVPTHGKTGKPNANHPNFAKHDADFKAQQKAMRPPAQPKLTLNDVWRQVEHVIGQIFPDGDPIDWMGPWLQKRGYKDFQVGDIINRAARANGYKDMYAYYDELKQQHADDQAYDAQMGESEQVDELSSATLKSYVPKANRSREKATDDMRKQGGYDAKVDDKMGRRAEFTMKAANKLNQPVKEDASAGGTSVGGIATGIAGAKGGKPGTGKPKELGNKVSRKQVQVGKGVY